MRKLTEQAKRDVQARTEEILRLMAERVDPKQAVHLRTALHDTLHDSNEVYWRLAYEHALQDVKQEFGYFEALYRHGVMLEEAFKKLENDSMCVTQAEKDVRQKIRYVLNDVENVRALKIIDHIGESDE